MLAHRVGERGERCFRRTLAALDRIEHQGVAIERSEALGGVRIAFVGNVVGAACERVDRNDRATQPAGTSHDATGKFS